MSVTLLRVRATGVVLALVALALTACSTDFGQVRLAIAAGSAGGVYNSLSQALATAWVRDVGVGAVDVQETAGAVDNLDRLRDGRAQVGFAQADVAATTLDAAEGTGHRVYALARMHDDYTQVVVRADLSARTVAELRGLRVSVGAKTSGTKVIAERVLASAGVDPVTDIAAQLLDINASVAAMEAGALDAFFWSGGIPTRQITDLSAKVQLRILDLSDVLPKLRAKFPVYGSATLPASTYQLSTGPIITLVVRNFLLVNDEVSDDVAQALTGGLFQAQADLLTASKVARSIEVRSAIETTPVPLHPGAIRYYRDAKV
ncbi:TAXI family TRAP transporter solute-binding subunit [Actinosynnema sp. NPDC020468]|uniref:TAXI family TRAP transporter solute-binding subunit n=1 Tax=Actinosynnema sp. NPDC020468 TaxID=3154488 RepID=UPI0033D7E78E